jgi:hypothetical protein
MATLIPYAAQFMSVPMFDPLTALVSVVVVAPAVLLMSLVCARLGTWLGNVERSQARAVDDTPTPVSAPAPRAAPREVAAR